MTSLRATVFLAVASCVATSALASPGAPGIAVPLYEMAEQCADPRLPALAGPWVVGCGAQGRVDRVLDLRSGRMFGLDPPLDRPGLGPSALYQVGWETRLVRLEQDGPVEAAIPTRIMDRPAGPPATDGTHVAILSADTLQVLEFDQRGRHKHETRAAGWYGVAISWPWVAWVADGWTDGEDVMVLDASAERPVPRAIAAGPGNQRHVVGSGNRLAWVEEDAVVVAGPELHQQVRYAASTGFSAPPTLWHDIACWEERHIADGIDIVCSDGVAATGPGDQQWPSRWDRWLLYRQGDHLMLFTAVVAP